MQHAIVEGRERGWEFVQALARQQKEISWYISRKRQDGANVSCNRACHVRCSRARSGVQQVWRGGLCRHFLTLLLQLAQHVTHLQDRPLLQLVQVNAALRSHKFAKSPHSNFGGWLAWLVRSSETTSLDDPSQIKRNPD